MLYRILTGDVSDNIDGICGLGLKTLLRYYSDLSEQDYDLELFLKTSRELRDKYPKRKMYESVLSNVDVLYRNFKLMQLHDVDISVTSIESIRNILSLPAKKYDMVAFKRMLIEDYIGSAFKYPDDWMRDTFSKLNRFVGQ